MKKVKLVKEMERFDMSIPPKKMKWFLRPIANLVANPGYKAHKPIINEVGMKDINEPFILLCNHNAFLDFKVAYHLLDGRDANYVVAIDGFVGREWLRRNVGCICKRKFTNDVTLVRQLKKALSMGNVAVIYPEARYSLCGTTAVLPESLGKMIKLFKVPVAVLICHGHHVNSPFWDSSHERGVVPTSADYKLVLTKEDIQDMTPDQINEKLVDEFYYDDFKWQRDNGVVITDPNRAKGLHHVLYQCPHCKTEYEMTSYGTTLKCNHCQKEWEMTELGELKAKKGETEFSHIPDWYEWERRNVQDEVKNGKYSSGLLNVRVDSLPNAKKFIPLGKGTLIHDMDGFKVKVGAFDGETYEMEKSVDSMYSCHIEYDYLFKYGDCIDLNTLDDTWYIYPEGTTFSVTKMALATEELYLNMLRKKGKTVKKGIA